MDNLADMKVCRVCLSINVKLYHMSKHKLSNMYERVVGVKIDTEDTLPKMLCWECAARLVSAHSFVDKAFKTHWILLTQLKDHTMVTMSDIESIDKAHYQLESTLGIKVFKETDSNLFIIRESDEDIDYNIENYVHYDESNPEFCELIDIETITTTDKQIIITEGNVRVEKEPSQIEYIEGTVEQNVSDENTKKANTGGVIEIIEICEEDKIPDKEMTNNNVSNINEMSQEKNPKLDEAVEVCKEVKQSRKRKHDSVTGQTNQRRDHSKKLRKDSEDISLSTSKHNTQDTFKQLTAQSSNDSKTAHNPQIKKKILKQSDENTKKANIGGEQDATQLQNTNSVIETIEICDEDIIVDVEMTNNNVSNVNEMSQEKNPTLDEAVKVCKEVKQSRKRKHDSVTGQTNQKRDHSKKPREDSEDITLPKTKNNTKDTSKQLTAQSSNNSKTAHNPQFKKEILKQINKIVKRNTGTDDSNVRSLQHASKSSKDMFICDMCDKKFDVKSTLIQHIMKHSKMNSSNSKSVTAHQTNNVESVSSSHSNDAFNCTFCTYKTNYKSNLSRHVSAKHSESSSYNCSLCSYKANRRSDLSDHINAKHTKSTSYDCSLCSFKTFYRYYLSSHMKVKHSEIKAFNCSFCSYQSNRLSNLTDHINAKHTKTVSFNCSQCDYKASRQSNLSDHINAKHTKSTYNCSLCDFKTYYQGKLSEHITVNHDKSISYNCSLCSYTTNIESRLSKHVNAKHTKKTSYDCSFCSFKAYYRTNLTKHINSQHTKSISYSCTVCSYTTHQQSFLTNHINAKHTKIISYDCSLCDYKTYNKRELPIHINAKHTKIKSYNCTFCSFKTYRRTDLHNHTSYNHTKDRPYICSLCNYITYKKSNLAVHIKSKHSTSTVVN